MAHNSAKCKVSVDGFLCTGAGLVAYGDTSDARSVGIGRISETVQKTYRGSGLAVVAS